MLIPFTLPPTTGSDEFRQRRDSKLLESLSVSLEAPRHGGIFLIGVDHGNPPVALFEKKFCGRISADNFIRDHAWRRTPPRETIHPHPAHPTSLHSHINC